MKKINTALTLSALAILCMSALAVPAEARDVFATPTVQATIQNNFAVRQQQLRSQISSDVSVGSLDYNTANGLTAQLDQINAQESQYLASQGMITGDQNQFIINEFTNISNQLANDENAAAYAPAPVVDAYAPIPVAVPNYVPVAVNVPVPVRSHDFWGRGDRERSFQPVQRAPMMEREQRQAFQPMQQAPRQMAFQQAQRFQAAARPAMNVAHNFEARPAFNAGRPAGGQEMHRHG
jgi:hypothetical protein